MARSQAQYAPVATSVRSARRFVAGALPELDEATVESTLLMVSELASNCVRHADADFTVAVEVDPGCVRVEVSDGSAGRPAPRRPEPEDTSGRGLLIVEALASAWGVEEHAAGKTVWFVLDRSAPEPAGG